jgi:Patatin-like phospholipase
MPGRNLCLLSLDGGGDRGLSSLLILKQLMESINPDRPPEPCEYFDMIGGISTGGYVISTGREMDMLTYSPRLMAIMLGRLRMGINECINTYISQFDRVFKKERHRATIMSKVQDRFDMKNWKERLKRSFSSNVDSKGAQKTPFFKMAMVKTYDVKCIMKSFLAEYGFVD